MPTSLAVPGSREGARRHPYLDIDIDGKAAERPYDFLRGLKNEELRKEQRKGNELKLTGGRSGLTHSNCSPRFPVQFTMSN